VYEGFIVTVMKFEGGWISDLFLIMIYIRNPVQEIEERRWRREVFSVK